MKMARARPIYWAFTAYNRLAHDAVCPFFVGLWDITINGACTVKVLDFEGKRNISGERIRLARLECRYSQQALAAKVQTVGVILEQDAISRIENGARMVQDYELRALARQLGKSTDWLLEIEE